MRSQMVRLSDAITIKHGYAFPGDGFSDDPSYPTLVTPGNFAIGGGFKTSRHKTFSGTYPEEFELSPGDLIVTMTDLSKDGATLGLPAVVPSSGVFLHNQRIGLVRVHDETKVDAGFLNYFFRTSAYRAHVLGTASGSTVRHTSPDRICHFVATLPLVHEQRAIAEVLGALDDKIAANDCIASTAKDLLATHFAKLRIDVATQDSRTMALSELIELNPRLPSPTVAEPAYLDMKSLPNEAMTITSWGYRVSRGGARFQNGDTLLARITPCLENGKVGFIDFLGEDEVGIGSTEYIVLRARNSVPRVLPYFLAASPRFREFAIRHMVGTSGRQRLAASDLSDFRVQRPDPYELAEFARVSGSLMPRVKASVDESRALAGTRDELLPLLMSGKVRVREEEKVVEEVT